MKPYPFRVALIVAVTAVAFWLLLSATIAQVTVAGRPDLALSWQNSSAAAQAGVAERIVTQRPSSSDARRAEALARSALEREPGNVKALRSLAMLAGLAGDAARTERLFRYGESLSRRDLPTQLWLIEREVARNDIPATLRHYDRALRTSVPIRELLVPILAQAAADPAVSAPLGALMRNRPNWWMAAADQIIRSNPSPRTIPVFINALRLDPGDSNERSFVELGLMRLVEAGEFRSAFRLYEQTMHANGRMLRNGDFSGGRGLPPMDWVLIDEAQLGSVIRLRRGDPALFLIADNAQSGEVARQLTGLRPGEYRASALIGDVSGDTLSRPLLSVRCAGSDGPELAGMRFPVTGSGGRTIELRFNVPIRDCDAQWITMQAFAPLDGQADTPWIDRLELATSQPRR